MFRNILKSNILIILTRYLSTSILGIFCIPFDLIFAKLLSIIFGNQLLNKENYIDLNFLGNFELNALNITLFLIIFGITPVLIRAFLAYKILDISKTFLLNYFKISTKNLFILIHD